MREAVALTSLGLTLTLVLARPRLPSGIRIGPASAAGAGVLLMLAAGTVDPSDARTAADVLWRPLVAIGSIMLMTAAAVRLGAIDRLAGSVVPFARGSAPRLFGLVFALSAGTSAVLNNDSAVLLLTPLVVGLVRVTYPGRDELLLPFAFAVFMAAGVAPLVTANPMNLIVADFAEIGFNTYAARMLPISVAGWLLTFLILRILFRRELTSAPEAEVAPPSSEPWTAGQRQALALVFVVFGAYPVVSYLGGSVWVVASAGAVVAVVLSVRHSAATPFAVVRGGVAWDILAFLVLVFVLAIGLQNAGLVDHLSDLYEGANAAVIGGASALGSALINNHSMALTNLLALEGATDSGREDFLAALIGGDLGPRLLPIGSLAGLLWISALGRLGVEVPLRRFVTVGVAVTVPALALSLALLAAGA